MRARSTRVALISLLAALLASLACNVPFRAQTTPAVIVVTFTPEQPAGSATSVLGPTSTAGRPTATLALTATRPPGTADPAATEEEACTLESDYVADVTIPDGTPVEAGSTFVKTWRLRNSGTCAWNSDYRLLQVSGQGLRAAGAVTLPNVAPGQTADISVTLSLSLETPLGSTQTAVFQIEAPNGQLFGARPYVEVVVAGPGGQVPATRTPAGSVTLGGVVWLDKCSPPNVEGSTRPQQGVCVATSSGGLEANGLRESDERGMAGIEVVLTTRCAQGATLVAKTTTDSSGQYRFSGLAPGTYCVSVNPVSETNSALLIPGAFTYPDVPGAVAEHGVTVNAAEQRTDLNFGWDPQLD